MLLRKKHNKEDKTLEEMLEHSGLNTFKIEDIQNIPDNANFEVIRCYDANGSNLEAYLLIASNNINEYYARIWISYSQWKRTFASKKLGHADIKTPKYIKQARFKISKKEFEKIAEEFNKQFVKSIAMNGEGFDKRYTYITNIIYSAIFNSELVWYH